MSSSLCLRGFLSYFSKNIWIFELIAPFPYVKKTCWCCFILRVSINCCVMLPRAVLSHHFPCLAKWLWQTFSAQLRVPASYTILHTQCVPVLLLDKWKQIQQMEMSSFLDILFTIVLQLYLFFMFPFFSNDVKYPPTRTHTHFF